MKKIVIVGGGISGLTSGIFAQKYGFESIVLEKILSQAENVQAGIGMAVI